MAIHIDTHDLMVANIHLLAQFATIKSPIDAVKFSNTLQISPNFNYEKKILNTHCDGQQFNEYQQEGFEDTK